MESYYLRKLAFNCWYGVFFWEILIDPPHPRIRSGAGSNPLPQRGEVSVFGVVPVFGGPVFYGSGDF